MAKLRIRYKKEKGKTSATIKIPAGLSKEELLAFIRRYEKEMMKRIDDNDGDKG